MVDNNTTSVNKESNLLSLLLFRFLPYWPLFALLLVVCGTGAWAYLRYATPIYEISGTVLLKDERKGVDDSRIVDFLNIYTSKKIVENEIEVIRSRTILKEVVNNLHLYAPVYEESYLKSISAYTSSPITIEAKEPGRIKEFKRVSFSYTPDAGVRIAHKPYLLNQWITTPYGVLRFTRNANKTRETKNSLYFSLVHPKIVINSLLNNLEVNAASKLSTVINLKLKDEVPERGEYILNEVTGVYNRSAINDKNSLAANTLTFVEDRMKIVETELDSIEKKIQQYKSQKGAIDLSAQGKLFLENVGDNDRKIADISMQLAVLDQVESYVVSKNSKTGIVPATLGVNDPILKQLLQRLYESELQYESLSQTIPENNSVVTSIGKEIEQIRPRILENIRNQQISLRASKRNMNETGNTFSSALQTLPTKERKLLEISREQSIKSNVYSFLLQKREEIGLSYAGGVADSRVVDKGESSIKPVSPKRRLTYLAAFVCAAGLAFATIIVKEFLSGKILFRSDIENYTKIPIAAEIANVKHKHELVIDQPEKVFIAEQFRQLGAAIGLYSKIVSSKKLLITSSIAGEGKSFVAANLALSLASTGKKVVLLDVDLRNSKSSSIFGLEQAKGMSDYLEGEMKVTEIIKKSKYNNNLYVIPAGGTSINPTELLLKGNLHDLFLHLGEAFDYILVDTSPVEAVIDTYVLAEYCDQNLFIIRHGYTPKTIVQFLDENNKIKALQNLSIVFNGVKRRGSIKGGYGFGYGYGYEYVYKERERPKQKRANTALN